MWRRVRSASMLGVEPLAATSLDAPVGEALVSRMLIVVAVICLLPSAVLAVHAALQHQLAWAAKRRADPAPPPPLDTAPVVTVQLPIRNERTVVTRLLRHVAALDHPRERLHVQILDDSTDETTAIVVALLPSLRAQGLRVDHVRRADPVGAKAGALEHGRRLGVGEFVLVLDADFVPRRDLLRQLLPWFRDPWVGTVQARWGHLDRSSTLLRRAQASMLDVHFLVEQAGRAALAAPVTFNGSAGMWRSAAIDAVGGWSAATLTEDLDLSCRAHLAGWETVYLPQVEVPAELPADLRAYRVQQRRWISGLAANARRYVPPIARQPDPMGARLHGAAHLLQSSLHVQLVAAGVGAVPLALVAAVGAVPLWVAANPLLAVAFVAMAGAHLRVVEGAEPWRRRITTYTAFLVLASGSSTDLARAAVRGARGRDAVFVRTPKDGDHGEQASTIRRYRPVGGGPTGADLALITGGATAITGAWLLGAPLVALWPAAWLVVTHAAVAGALHRSAIASRRSQRAAGLDTPAYPGA